MKKDLSRKPQNINSLFWYYEEPGGLTMVHKIEDNEGKYLRTDQFIISWQKILASVNRLKKNN